MPSPVGHALGGLAAGWLLQPRPPSRPPLASAENLVFVALAAAGVAVLHLSVPVVLIGVGLLAILWYRPRRNDIGASP